MDPTILEAQKRLEERRQELNATTTQPTSLAEGLADEEKQFCDKCGQEKVKVGLEGLSSWFICRPCISKEEEEHKAQLEILAEKTKEAKHQAKISQLLSSCSIGERFKGMTFDDYKPVDKKAEEALESCKQYVANFTGKSSNNLLLIGSPGTGKNMLAAIICQELIHAGFPCIHTTAMKVVRKVKDSWRDKDVSEQSVIDSMVEPALLVIDEVGVQFGSTTEQLYLTEIINERYEKQRPTILISNLKLSELTAIMGERVIDRFYDDGSKLLVFAWQSYRRREK